MKSETQEAIERARGHLDAALREGMEAGRALIDAARSAGGLSESAAGGLADEVKSVLETWIANLEDGRAFSMPGAIAEPLERALQAEIARWEERSATDETARPVLRAFLGLRELLWEMGMRGRAETANEDQAEADTGGHRASDAADRETKIEGPESSGSRTTGPRIQRFNLDD